MTCSAFPQPRIPAGRTYSRSNCVSFTNLRGIPSRYWRTKPCWTWRKASRKSASLPLLLRGHWRIGPANMHGRCHRLCDRRGKERLVDCQVKCNRAEKKISAGERQARHLRGRRFNREIKWAMSSGETGAKSEPLGRNSRIRPFVFSLVPRCQGARGSAK